MRAEIHIEDFNAYDIYVFLMDAVTILTLTRRRLPSDELLKNQQVQCFYFYFLCYLYSRAQLIYC